MGGGAWPFLVGGLICLVNSDNERDLILLISDVNLWLARVTIRFVDYFLEGLSALLADGSLRQKQVCDALRCPGLHARYTGDCNECFPSSKGVGKLFNDRRDWD